MALPAGKALSDSSGKAHPMTSEPHLTVDLSSAPSPARQADQEVSYRPGTGSHARIALFNEVRVEGLAVAALLQADGHAAVLEESAQAFVEMACRECFDLLVINWGSQSMQGMDVLKNVRSLPSANSSSTRILVLTTRDSEFEIVQALESGADDCAPPSGRPFELIARVKALLRTTRATEARPLENVQGFTFHRGTHIVEGNDIKVRLAPREFELAHLLFLNFESTVTRTHLVAALWDRQGTSRSVDQHIGRIRRKLKLFPEKGFALQAVYGVGYVVRAVRLQAPTATTQATVS